MNKNEFDCIHLWPVMPNNTMKPCEHCGAIYEHIQLIDALEDAFEYEEKAKGPDFQYARASRIAARKKILDVMRKAEER